MLNLNVIFALRNISGALLPLFRIPRSWLLLRFVQGLSSCRSFDINQPSILKIQVHLYLIRRSLFNFSDSPSWSSSLVCCRSNFTFILISISWLTFVSFDSISQAMGSICESTLGIVMGMTRPYSLHLCFGVKFSPILHQIMTCVLHSLTISEWRSVISPGGFSFKEIYEFELLRRMSIFYCTQPHHAADLWYQMALVDSTTEQSTKA